jgi:hypothetical protein
MAKVELGVGRNIYATPVRFSFVQEASEMQREWPAGMVQKIKEAKGMTMSSDQ